MPEDISINPVINFYNIITGTLKPSFYRATDIRDICDLCTALQCNSLLDLLNEYLSTLPLLPDLPEGSTNKRKAPLLSSSAKETETGVQSSSSVTTSYASSSSSVVATLVKLERSEPNPDYMDKVGIVKLSSSDEMAMHYCIICQACSAQGSDWEHISKNVINSTMESLYVNLVA